VPPPFKKTSPSLTREGGKHTRNGAPQSSSSLSKGGFNLVNQNKRGLNIQEIHESTILEENDIQTDRLANSKSIKQIVEEKKEVIGKIEAKYNKQQVGARNKSQNRQAEDSIGGIVGNSMSRKGQQQQAPI